MLQSSLGKLKLLVSVLRNSVLTYLRIRDNGILAERAPRKHKLPSASHKGYDDEGSPSASSGTSIENMKHLPIVYGRDDAAVAPVKRKATHHLSKPHVIPYIPPGDAKRDEESGASALGDAIVKHMKGLPLVYGRDDTAAPGKGHDGKGSDVKGSEEELEPLASEYEE